MLNKDEMLKLLKKQEENTNNENSNFTKNEVFPFWNTPVGKSCNIRLLPDKNPDNPVFWVDKTTRSLTFNGVKGKTDKLVNVVVPAFNTTPSEQMWVPEEFKFSNKEDPIQSALAGWYEERPEDYKKYKRKISHIYQGFVKNDGGAEKPEDKPDTILRRLNFIPKIHKYISNPEILAKFTPLPIDYEKGRNIEIHITQDGKYKDYTMNWDFTETSLTNEELTLIAEDKLLDLSTFLLKKPNDAEKNAMLEMFEASVQGLSYDFERWGQYYKPYGNFNEDDNTQSNTTTSKPDASSIVQQVKYNNIKQVENKPVETVKPTMEVNNTSELLEQIKNNQTKENDVAQSVANAISSVVTATVEPTVTPAVTPTVTPAVTPTVTPAVTPTVTPTTQTNDDLLARIKSLQQNKQTV